MPYYNSCEQESMQFTHLQKEAYMKKHGKGIVAVLAMIALIVGLSGCAKEGPMEKAGKKVDKAVEDIKK